MAIAQCLGEGDGWHVLAVALAVYGDVHMTTTKLDRFRLSQRVTLTKGMRFRATGGPLFRLTSGATVAMGARGPFVFLAHCKLGDCEYIEALDRDGSFVPLHIAGPRRQVSTEIVTRPYRIRSTIRTTKPSRR